ncbi:hypothetical protein COOONC_00202 [Cooperia oncophora]
MGLRITSKLFLAILYHATELFVPATEKKSQKSFLPQYLDTWMHKGEHLWKEAEIPDTMENSESLHINKTLESRLRKYNASVGERIVSLSQSCKLCAHLRRGLSRRQHSTRIIQRGSQHFGKASRRVGLRLRPILNPLLTIPLSFISKVAHVISGLPGYFNLSFMKSEALFRWTQSSITPIPEKRPYTKAENFRPEATVTAMVQALNDWTEKWEGLGTVLEHVFCLGGLCCAGSLVLFKANSCVHWWRHEDASAPRNAFDIVVEWLQQWDLPLFDVKPSVLHSGYNVRHRCGMNGTAFRRARELTI